ncbi:MAG: DUF2442 domain-containing protein [Pyrinomonadaceae bacterium]
MGTIRITGVKPLYDFVVELEFSDGLKKELDLDVYLNGEIFEPLRNDPELFRSVRIAERERTISWPNGADIDPYTLYYGLTPEWDEQDDALAEALELRRSGSPLIPPGTPRPGLEIR